MTNLQTIKSAAKSQGLTFKATSSTVNGAKLYNFVDKFGRVVARNWTISSAIGEHTHGNLEGKMS